MRDEISYVTMKLSKAIRYMDGPYDTIENENKYLLDISSIKIARKLLVRPSGVTGFRTT